MKSDIFVYKDYRLYLRDFIRTLPKKGRGFQASLAGQLGCPVSHISQVLSARSNFSMEQAEAVNQFVGHTEDEAEFFLLLVQLGRAGSKILEQRIQNQMQKIVDRRMVLKERLGVASGISEEDQAKFYSSWLFGAVHILLTIPSMQTKSAISNYLGISLKKTGEILEFLVQLGLVKQIGVDKFEIGLSRIHLGADSPLISKFHTNWRMQAIKSFDEEEFHKNLHYSSVISVSEDDFLKLKSEIIDFIAKAKERIKASPAERLACFNLDFFVL